MVLPKDYRGYKIEKGISHFELKFGEIHNGKEGINIGGINFQVTNPQVAIKSTTLDQGTTTLGEHL